MIVVELGIPHGVIQKFFGDRFSFAKFGSRRNTVLLCHLYYRWMDGWIDSSEGKNGKAENVIMIP